MASTIPTHGPAPDPSAPAATITDDQLVDLLVPQLWQFMLSLAGTGRRGPDSLALLRRCLDHIEAEGLAPCGCAKGDVARNNHDDKCDTRHVEPDDAPAHDDVVNDGSDTWGCKVCCSPTGCPLCRPAPTSAQLDDEGLFP